MWALYCQLPRSNSSKKAGRHPMKSGTRNGNQKEKGKLDIL